MGKGKSRTTKLSPEGIEKVPDNKPVVYKILNQGTHNIYTGTAKRGRVQARLKEHLPGGPDPIPGGAKVHVQQMPSISDAKKTEARIISRSKPKHNE
jgi:predicted GIY-YIG superfamily endonuclease